MKIEQGAHITSTHPDTGIEKRFTVLTVPEKMRMGDEHKVLFWAYEIGGDSDDQKAFIAKHVYKRSADDATPAYSFVANWQRVRSAGITTFEEIGILSPHDVLFPVLLLEGGRFYGKHEHRSLGVRRPDDLDAVFCDIPLEEIARSARDIATRATVAQFILPFDGPCDLLLPRFGPWHLGTYDVTMVSDKIPTWMNLEDENISSVYRFLDQIDSMQWALGNRLK